MILRHLPFPLALRHLAEAVRLTLFRRARNAPDARVHHMGEVTHQGRHLTIQLTSHPHSRRIGKLLIYSRNTDVALRAVEPDTLGPEDEALVLEAARDFATTHGFVVLPRPQKAWAAAGIWSLVNYVYPR